MNQWIEAKEAAELAGISRQRIHQVGHVGREVKPQRIRRKRKPGSVVWLYLRVDVLLYEVNGQQQANAKGAKR